MQFSSLFAVAALLSFVAASPTAKVLPREDTVGNCELIDDAIICSDQVGNSFVCMEVDDQIQCPDGEGVLIAN